MIRLGLRLAFLGGRWSVVPTVLTAVAVAFGTAILLFALSFEPALDVRYDRGAWRDTPGPRGVAEQLPGTTLISLTNDYVEGRPLARIDVAALGSGAPVPPGLTRLPDAGETFVSPALAELMAERPAGPNWPTGSARSAARSARRACRPRTSWSRSTGCPRRRWRPRGRAP